MILSARRYNIHYNILTRYCNDYISQNGKYYYEFVKTAKNVLMISNNTFENKLKYVPDDLRILRERKQYISQDVIIKNLTETNQLFAIPLLEELKFIERKTDTNTRALGLGVPFSRIIKHDGMKTINENGNAIKGLRDEILFLDSIVYTLKYFGLGWPGNLDFQCTKVVDGYRYDLYIKCSKICIEYNEYKTHHTSDVGISHDDEKKRITNGEGYLLVNFDQTRKSDDYKQNTLAFIKDLIPLIRKRRHLYDFDTPDKELYLDYLVNNGIDKDIASELQEIALHKNEFKVTLQYLMEKSMMDSQNEADVERVLKLIKKLDDDIWKNFINDELVNDRSNMTIDNIRLNHRGFVKVSILINTDYSHKILDYYMKIDELCGKLFNEIRTEQKNCFKRIEDNKNSYKYKLESQQILEAAKIEAIKQSKDLDLENKDIIIESNTNELKLIKPILKAIKKTNISKLPYKLKKAIQKYQDNTTFKKDYNEIQDGDILFEQLPNLIYSQYSDDYITFKEIKDIWNAQILTKDRQIKTYKELKAKFIPLQNFDNINIEIEEYETNSAHNIDNNQITNVRWIREDYDLESESESESDSNSDSDLDALSDSDSDSDDSI